MKIIMNFALKTWKYFLFKNEKIELNQKTTKLKKIKLNTI